MSCGYSHLDISKSSFAIGLLDISQFSPTPVFNHHCNARYRNKKPSCR